MRAFRAIRHVRIHRVPSFLSKKPVFHACDRYGHRPVIPFPLPYALQNVLQFAPLQQLSLELRREISWDKLLQTQRCVCNIFRKLCRKLFGIGNALLDRLAQAHAQIVLGEKNLALVDVCLRKAAAVLQIIDKRNRESSVGLFQRREKVSCNLEQDVFVLFLQSPRVLTRLEKGELAQETRAQRVEHEAGKQKDFRLVGRIVGNMRVVLETLAREGYRVLQVRLRNSFAHELARCRQKRILCNKLCVSHKPTEKNFLEYSI